MNLQFLRTVVGEDALVQMGFRDPPTWFGWRRRNTDATSVKRRFRKRGYTYYHVIDGYMLGPQKAHMMVADFCAHLRDTNTTLGLFTAEESGSLGIVMGFQNHADWLIAKFYLMDRE